MKKSLITAAITAISAASLFALPVLPKEDGGRIVKGEPVAARAASDSNGLNALSLSSASVKAAEKAPAITLSLPSGGSLYGFLAYDGADSDVIGWYSLRPTGEKVLQWAWDDQFLTSGLFPRGMWMRNGRFCTHAVASYSGDQQLYGSMYMELNPSTGALLNYEVVDVYENPYSNIVAPAYVESEDKIYGFSIDPNGAKYSFSCAPADDLNAATEVRRLENPGERCYALAYNRDEKCFYGINFFDKLVRIGMDGVSEEICSTPISGISGVRAGFVYSPMDGCYFYCPQLYEKPSAIYAVYPAEKKFVLLTQFDVDKEFGVFYSPDNASVTDKSPSVPVVKETAFTAGELNASVTYTLPATAVDGSALESSLNWKACIDSKEFASGTAAPGADVKVDFTGLKNGYRCLQFFASAGNVGANPAVATVFAGFDNPATPTNVQLTDSKVSWTRVRRGEHNEHFVTSALSYNVYINGELAGNTTTNSFDISLDPEKPVSAYTATVVATANGLDSKPGVSNKLVFGAPLTLPLSFTPEASDFDLMTAFNLDGGPAFGEWSFSADRWDRPCFSSGWSSERDANDWLILPGAVFPDAGKAYRLKLDVACGGYSGKEEFFEVWLGTSPDPAAMTTPIISKTQVRSMEWENYTNLFGVPEAGTYYIGIHAVSKPNQYALIVSNISLDATDLSALAPEAAGGLIVAATNHAALTADVEFTLPSRYLTGAPIAADATVKAVATTAAGSAEVSGAPGSAVKLTVPTLQGDNIISVVCHVGETAGNSCEIIAFTGVDVANYVENLSTKVTEDNMGIEFTWEAPLSGLYEGYFEPTGIEYYLGEIDDYGEFLEEPRLAGKDVYSYTYRLPDNTKLAYRRIAIVASNAAGMSPARSYIYTTVGKPYSLPINEGFDNMTIAYAPLSAQTPTAEYTNGGWDWAQPELVDPAFDHGAGDFALCGYTDEAPARVGIALPKFSTEGCDEVLLTFDIWNGAGRPSEIKVYGGTYGQSNSLIETIPEGEGWEEYDVVLPARLLNRPWVTVILDAKLPASNNYMLFSGYRIGGTTGVRGVEVDTNADAPAEYYNLQGIRVEAPASGGIYIVRKGSAVSKMIVR